MAGGPAGLRPRPGRPAAGRPAAGRPAAGRPAAGRPAAGRPAAGRRDRPGPVLPATRGLPREDEATTPAIG